MVRIVTDSTSDLPRELAEQLGIRIVPLRVIFGAESLRDGIDITPEAFFNRLKASPVLPTTSQPSPADFQAVFQEAIQAGEEIVCLTISAALSGTYLSATMARESFLNPPISVIDTRTTSMALGMLAEEAARMAMAGASRQQIVARVERLIPLTHVLFTVDTLEYLQRGGRIGGAQALLGTLLNIKPLLTLRDGRVEPVERVRTKRKALDRMIEIAVQRAQETGYGYRVAVIHGQAPDEADYVASRACDQIRCIDLHQSEVGPVLGTHVGPGVVGIAFMPVLAD
ncbi:MAG: DegV family protein [Anaerolineae bacterium]|nr:DegV family protein [Anaerolineae bacterium]MDW8099485.1 DegV family protein [Anaerolineae bacterium]